MICDRKAANAMGGKTARACDGCLRKRARLYCAADDAFLCQGCDTSVHSANQLASRHERVRLPTASSSKFNNNASLMNPTNQDPPPAWHQGFTRKARTPRLSNKSNNMLGQTKDDEGFKVFNLINPLHPLVPEIGSEEGSVDENEEQLLCRVPVFDPFAAELCNMVTSDGDEVAMVSERQGTCELDDGLHGLLPSDIDDLAEFAADVESLLGVGLDEETCCDIKGSTELLDSKGEDLGESSCLHEQNIVKVKDEDEDEEDGVVEGISTAACCFDSALRESLNWSSLGYMGEEEEEKGVPAVAETSRRVDGESKAEMKRKMLLRLNYESVISAWATQGSPWTTGSRPQFNPDDFMGDGVGGGIGGVAYSYSQQGNHNNIAADGEREARVSRYREKRRTRLFSKKIRYEVRKLNAEKRPRMKGRFVKRTSFVGTTTPAFSYSTATIN